MALLKIDLIGTTILNSTICVIAFGLTMNLIRMRIGSLRQRPLRAIISERQQQ